MSNVTHGTGSQVLSGLNTDLDPSVLEVPERGIYAAVIQRAIDDARMKHTTISGGLEHKRVYTNNLGLDGIDFLFTPKRSDKFFENAGMDPEIARRELLRVMHTDSMIFPVKSREKENKERRAFRLCYMIWRDGIRFVNGKMRLREYTHAA